MRTLIILSGLNTNPHPLTPAASAHYSAFAAEAAVLAARQGWNYEFLPGYQHMTLRQGVDALRKRLRELSNHQVTVVASSYGCWIALLAMSGRWRGCWRPNHRLVLVNPYVDARSTYDALPWYGKAFARTFGFPRKGENGKRGFWVPPWVVHSMLAPENSVFSGRLLGSMPRDRVLLLDVTSEPSAYKPSATLDQLAQQLATHSLAVSRDEVPHLIAHF